MQITNDDIIIMDDNDYLRQQHEIMKTARDVLNNQSFNEDVS
jgi:hypothetical protein